MIHISKVENRLYVGQRYMIIGEFRHITALPVGILVKKPGIY